MRTEKEKMLAGELYYSGDPQLVEERKQARELCFRLNTENLEGIEKKEVINRLFGAETDVYITPPFHCDYGKNIRLGKKVYFNFNCVVLDCAQVTIGDHVMFAPGVQILTATHPLEANLRRQELEFGKPITIGNDVWVGAGALILPGVTIGDNVVIGAGSIVPRDIESGVVAAGNPCKVIKRIS